MVGTTRGQFMISQIWVFDFCRSFHRPHRPSFSRMASNQIWLFLLILQILVASGGTSNAAEWETCLSVQDFDWKQIAEPVMQVYTETTDGSHIEAKESALVWNYQYADCDFGSCQAKELLDHLESVLANEPVSVKSGPHIVEVKPQGVNKGIVAERLLITMRERGVIPDFVLCIGDDRSDEDMFEVIMSARDSLSPVAEVFACTVGQKPSKAKYYLEDTSEILRMLQGLAHASEHSAKSPSQHSPHTAFS